MADKKTPKQNDLHEIATKLFALLGVKVSFTITEDTVDDQRVMTLDIDAGDNTGLIIGRKGETLMALQTFLGSAINTPGDDTWTRVVVNVGGWREKEEERLEQLALQAAQRAEETGNPQSLYNLTSTQRRIIHLALADNTTVETVSEGEGGERHLVIKPKQG